MSPRARTTVEEEEKTKEQAEEETEVVGTGEGIASDALSPWRYFTVSVDLQLRSQNQDVPADAIADAVKEQINLPSAVSVLPNNIEVVGVSSSSVSESSTPTEVEDGYGRSSDFGEAARNQEKLSPPEAIVGAMAVKKSGLELSDEPNPEEDK